VRNIAEETTLLEVVAMNLCRQWRFHTASANCGRKGVPAFRLMPGLGYRRT